MRCVVFGATGYVGARLVPRFQAEGHSVRVLARQPARLTGLPWREQVEVVEGDVTDRDAVDRALNGQQVLYYLVHSLLRSDFVKFDARAASIVADAAARTGLSRIIYVGGIIPDDEALSHHLASRAEVGGLLRGSGIPTVELRASAIVGTGSASFEMLRYLCERLPVTIAPPWLRTRAQPIAVRDVLHYLSQAAYLPAQVNRSFDIGGPDVLTYVEMMRKYVAVAGLSRRIEVPVPALNKAVSARAVDLMTPIPGNLAASLIDSLDNEMVCRERDIVDYIGAPPEGLTHFEHAVELALERADPSPTDPAWAGGSLYQDVRERHTAIDADTMWRILESIGAESNWIPSPLTWSARGWLAEFGRRLGIRGNGRAPHTLHTGEVLDWWRVEQLDPPHLLRLRADVPVPGRLWLELSVLPARGDRGSVLRQRALFQPRGVVGHACWKAMIPLRQPLFEGMARHLAGAAAPALTDWQLRPERLTP
jgi:uncharacterized protein YbjT (DUF2867 family)